MRVPTCFEVGRVSFITLLFCTFGGPRRAVRGLSMRLCTCIQPTRLLIDILIKCHHKCCLLESHVMQA